MKKLITAIILCASLYAQAQTNSIPEPEFTSRPYYLKDGQLVSIEKTSASIDVAGMGAKVFLTAFKPASTSRFKEAPALYIKMEGSGDPADKIKISIATVKKDRRRFIQESTGMTGAAKDISASKVSVSFKKIRDGLYQIVFDAPLAPGEYALMPPIDMSSIMGGGSLTLYCFGID